MPSIEALSLRLWRPWSPVPATPALYWESCSYTLGLFMLRRTRTVIHIKPLTDIITVLGSLAALESPTPPWMPV
jgi:hypothetical protein